MDKARFLEQIATHPCYGDPKHTYSDVEKAIKSRVRHMGFDGYYVDIARTEAEAAERAMLARLQAKYVSPASASPLLPSSPLQSPLSIHLHPPAAPISDETVYLDDIPDEDEQGETPQYSLFA